MYSIKTRIVGFFLCCVYPRQATCEYSKRHTFTFCSHNFISSHVVYMVHGTCLMAGQCTMYMRHVHTRAGRIWRVHDDKELQAICVPLFQGFFSLIAVISSLILCLLVKRKIKRTRFNPRPKPYTLACC